LQELIFFLKHMKFGLSDVLDIFLVFLVLRYLLQAIQGTRAIQILQGIGMVMLMLLVAHLLYLQTLIWLLNWSLVSVAVVLPIIFQPELRRALMRLGRQGMLSTGLARMEKEELAPLIDELAYAAFSLAQVRVGALIVLEQETGLKEFIEQGQQIGGIVSWKLLISIFNPKTPLHDGAVIIRGNRIVAAACFLESGHDQEADDRFGTRHRAALSVSSQTDCVVIVVSEETGQVRIAHDARFSRPMDDEGEIKKALTGYLVASQTAQPSRGLSVQLSEMARTLKGKAR
jgi:diadenylate cyclase